MMKWCKLSCRAMGIVLAGAGAAVLLLTLLPVWLIVSLLGVLLILLGVSMLF